MLCRHQYMSRKTMYSTLQQLLIRRAIIIYYVILGHVSIQLHCTLVVGRCPCTVEWRTKSSLHFLVFQLIDRQGSFYHPKDSYFSNKLDLHFRNIFLLLKSWDYLQSFIIICAKCIELFQESLTHLALNANWFTVKCSDQSNEYTYKPITMRKTSAEYIPTPA